MNSNTLPQVTARRFVAIQHDRINLSVFEVQDLGDDTELTTYVGHGYEGFEDKLDPQVRYLLNGAAGTGRSTGSRSASYTDQIDGVPATLTWYANRYQAPRLTRGVHRKIEELDDATQVLVRELSAQRTRLESSTPAIGERYIVTELTGYRVIQDRPFDHRECGCHTGTTRYSAGTVTGITHWADNSIDVHVELADGREVSDQIKAPSGDVCF